MKEFLLFISAIQSRLWGPFSSEVGLQLWLMNPFWKSLLKAAIPQILADLEETFSDGTDPSTQAVMKQNLNMNKPSLETNCSFL